MQAKAPAGESAAAQGTMKMHGPIIDERAELRTRTQGQCPRRGRRQDGSRAGYSLIELMLVVLIAMVMGAMAIPQARSAIASYQLSAAVDSATGIIQGTRYQAIMHGYLYQVDFNSTTKDRKSVV